jgi:hypothetical protein
MRVTGIADRGSVQPRSPPPATVQLSFLLGAGSFGAAVTAGEFLDPARGIDKLLFAGKKGMTSGTNADLNIATRGASVIHRAACAHHIGFVVFWMNACFHLLNGARNVFAIAGFCKR